MASKILNSVSVLERTHEWIFVCFTLNFIHAYCLPPIKSRMDQVIFQNPFYLLVFLNNSLCCFVKVTISMRFLTSGRQYAVNQLHCWEFSMRYQPFPPTHLIHLHCQKRIKKLGIQLDFSHQFQTPAF